MSASVPVMRLDVVSEFPYKHSTGEVIGRFLAGLKEQKRIWGQRVAGLGVVVPPVGYSEQDGSPGGEWVEVKPTGVVTAAAVVHEAVEGLHPCPAPFAFVLVKDRVEAVRVGARVEAVWRSDDERVGSIRDIAHFRLVD
jgi:uncharacterized OB-fold protein